MKTNICISGGHVSGLLIGILLTQGDVDMIAAERDAAPLMD
ncbi:hypothetical protein RRU94_09490 [Domibacillus sp. DTU_2020_1001157_1_SI_ALB_TIR_016]|nr:hypothetical protein [Domibacillus sp. DTU_2020_1001157_1_SI_ALB_TIR_016]WNS81043.1 hypothetical protein RRU94_09490 [Domibacillus sp. DTU_2020_1001157_1_SI_ALB_TIR_016]